jgi:hypothetical protein
MPMNSCLGCRAGIRKGKLETLNLLGLRHIIEAEKLNQFLYKRN